MKLSKLFAGLFGLLGIALGGISVWLALSCTGMNPILLVPSEEARSRTEAVMDAACRGDYESASGMILGNPRFAMEGTPEDPVASMIWERFRKSFSYELTGECYATEAGLAQGIRVTYLELPTELSEQMMRKREAATGTSADIHERDAAYLRRCRDNARKIAGSCGGQLIDCSADGRVRTVEDIHDQAWNLVALLLKSE